MHSWPGQALYHFVDWRHIFPKKSKLKLDSWARVWASEVQLDFQPTNTLAVSVCSKYAGSQRSYVGAKVWQHGQDVQNALQCFRGMQEALTKTPSQNMGDHGVFLAFPNTWRISVKTVLRLSCALVALRTVHLCWWITYRVWSLLQTQACFRLSPGTLGTEGGKGER